MDKINSLTNAVQHEMHAVCIESDNVCGDKLAESAYSAVKSCEGCGRRFVPTGPQRYCSHDCYSGALRVPIEQRFWTKVNKTSDCWLWTAATIRGYGQIAIDRRPHYAHRVSWELVNGPIPDGLECLHRCDVPLCVRPDHLFLGSQQDNLADARQKGRLDESLARTRILTPDDRMAIYTAPGYRGVVVNLAREYGVGKGCISVIRKGRFKRPRQPLRLVSQRDQPFQSVHGRHLQSVPHTSSIPLKGVR